MKVLFKELFLGLGLAFGVMGCQISAVDEIDPMVGTEGTGTEYGGMMPYTGVPFGSMQVVPMTRTNAVGRTSFNALDKKFLGIVLTRQPAIWMGDTAPVRLAVAPSDLTHLEAHPWRTRVTLADGRVYEWTATSHAAWIRFPADNPIGLSDGESSERMDANLGYPLPNLKGYHVVERVGANEMKIGLSMVSRERARENLKELGANFEATAAATRAAWEDQLGRIEIDASDEVRRIFATAQYHAALYPREWSERGVYHSAFDDCVHTGVAYTAYSLWDTYRAEHPLLILTNPERVGDMMQSLLEMYREGGWLPKWPNPGYTGIMTGAPAEIVLNEAMVKGVRGFDYALAREAIHKNATVPQVNDLAQRWNDRGEFGRTPETRAGLTHYLEKGYVACDYTSASVSRTLDFALADRSATYTNIWCAEKRGFRPRRSDGVFRDDRWGPYTECSPATALWCVPHDPQGLVQLLGGKAAYEAELDRFFAEDFFKSDAYGRTLHGNEPNHHIPYMYNAVGAYEKTQQTVRRILRECYSTNRIGFEGNEDCGAMSAWYIFSALGFYPMDPASGFYEIGSPIVRRARLHLANARTLEIRVKNFSEGDGTVKSVTFSGKPLPNFRLSHHDLIQGGELIFEMK